MLKAPFPWFGGKSRAAHLIWERLGDVPNYVEPFAGSLAVLLARPTAPQVETVNDLDCLLANFWRALKHDPAAVAHHADWPVNEADLKARHLWLVVEGRPLAERVKEDPDFYDPKVAGWWVWGLSQWIGGEWCTDQRARQRKMPDMAPGKGVHRQSLHRPTIVHNHVPHLSSAGTGVHRSAVSNLEAYLGDLSDRLRRVRVVCGDWSRVVKPSATIQIGTTGVLLDPPYSTEADRDMRTYRTDCGDVAHACREWALANGDNPKLRIALCGYDGEHPMPAGWQVVEWESHGGYGSLGKGGRGHQNKKRERIWFSPHCVQVGQQLDLFGGLEVVV